METSSGHQNQSQNVVGESQITEPLRSEIFVAPGVPVVRGNTPKPLTWRGYSPGIEQPQMTQPTGHETAPVPGFPIEAPAAPPLPEESEGERNNTTGAIESNPVSHSSRPDVSSKAASEFVWLFEYGLEMNASLLNSPERLNGLAMQYGPAILKGYRLAFDAVEPRSRQVVVNMRPDGDPQASVWGVLYRIPRRLTERRNGELSMLDRLHLAAHFEPQEVVVHEMYRKRDINCLTYVASATARQQFRLLPKDQQVIDNTYIQRLLTCAQEQKLPSEYLNGLAQFATASHRRSISQSDVILVSAKNDTSEAPGRSLGAPGLAVDVQPGEIELPVEQNTEPLPALVGKTSIVSSKNSGQKEKQPITSGPWLMSFALYLVLLFLLILALSVLQALGGWGKIFPANFAPLGAPWFVLAYGLLGGCISGIVTIGHRRSPNPPGFVVMTWFIRPFIGAMLAALAYLALRSGFFVLTGTTEQHYALFSLVGAVAGLCERWVFFRRA